MNWIKARLNKDNFWNMMFWLGMTIGIAVSQYVSEYRGLFILSIVSTLLIVPLITKYAQGVKFDKDNGFLTSSGRSLEDSLPKYWGFAAFASIGFVYFLLFIVIAPITFYYSMAVLFVTLYFILINCPISILFNKNAVRPMSQCELKNYMYNPVYRHLNCNIYHRR